MTKPKLDAAVVERRLEDIEVKLAFTEDQLEKLDAVVVRQQQQIELLTRELVQLRQQGSAEPATVRSLRDELPPHY
ncbi:SlyX protein [Rubrivivax gelatinosus]|uniref:SlyX protein n=1 Tax=Rubrivivax gelatinosus TaxID=28068 RepID=A0ABS1E1H8_RUBGE|nr:SlyX family protein [Rubrivivax gelatinosus]MBK1613843.1 SlyX protein [Rubrivivax gelatinosus]MBK1715558.1 SlyX protein [Rubrivivax gelatinosus]MBZ8141115.1 SlyX protein [Rubrivivax gelatinosus]